MERRNPKNIFLKELGFDLDSGLIIVKLKSIKSNYKELGMHTPHY